MTRWSLAVPLALFVALGCGKKMAEEWDEDPVVTPLEVTRVDPPNGSVLVPATIQPTLIFNRTLMVRTVENGVNLRLARVESDEPLVEIPVAADIELEGVEEGHSAIFKPLAPLDPETRYTIFVDTTVLNVDGDGLDEPYRTSFTTAP